MKIIKTLLATSLLLILSHSCDKATELKDFVAVSPIIGTWELTDIVSSIQYYDNYEYKDLSSHNYKTEDSFLEFRNEEIGYYFQGSYTNKFSYAFNDLAKKLHIDDKLNVIMYDEFQHQREISFGSTTYSVIELTRTELRLDQLSWDYITNLGQERREKFILHFKKL